MELEILIGIAAVFVSGGAIGTAGTLLTQWVLRGLGEPRDRGGLPDAREMARMRGDLRALIRKVHNMDERLDFQEQLLGGASPTRSPPQRLPQGEEELEGEGEGDGHPEAETEASPRPDPPEGA